MNDAPLATSEEKAGLSEVRRAVLTLHKAMLDAEKIHYERAHGRIESSMQFLALLQTDPFFAWLRPLTSLIIRFDEEVEGKEPLTAANANALREVANSLLNPDQNGAEFQRNYDRVIQASPDVLILHAKVERMLAI